MTLHQLLLVFLGSLFHVLWNTLVKKVQKKFLFLWWAITLSVALCFPLLATRPLEWPSSPWSMGWLYLLATGLIHGVYFITLSKAYEKKELSKVYPYSRAIGTLVAVGGSFLLLGESPSLFGLIGITLILSASFMVGKAQTNWKELKFVVVTGLMIGTYFLIDKKGMSYFDPGLYLCLMFLISSLMLVPLVYKDPERWSLWKKHPWELFLGAIFMYGSYFLILGTIKEAYLSYVVSARALGVFLSGLLGFFLFKEKQTMHEWLSILIIMVGILFLGLA